MVAYLPIIKLEPEKYLIGVHAKHLQLKGTNVLVTTGGGFMPLGDYLKHYSRFECIELSTLMRKSDGTLKTTVINLLNRHKTDKEDNKIVRRYEKLCNPEID